MKRIFIAAMMFVMLTCTAAVAGQYGDVVYNKVNIHVDRARATKASYANYTETKDWGMIPINTKMTVGKWRSGFTLTVEKTGEVIHYEYNRRRMKMTVAVYLDKITSPEPVKLKLSKIDTKGVKNGTALPGMTKAGIMAALGYPATHRTPNLDVNKWVYWINRFRTRAVNFNDKGIVTSVQPEFKR
jgi:hypothetical protein